MTFDLYLPSRARGFCGEAIGEYRKRLRAFCKCGVHFGGVKIQNAGVSVLVREPSADTAQFSSEGFSELISGWMNGGASKVAFFIYGGDGINYDMSVALAYYKMDADLLAVLLIEQIYRGFMIRSGRAYHK